MMNIELDDSYIACWLPTNKIWIEFGFNCRESLTLISLEELARSIEARGLQFPILVQPRDDVPQIPEGFDYRLIVGFRRFTACTKILKHEKIRAVIRKGLTEQDARILNLLENIDRKDLNILEEAKALAAIFPDENTPISQISTAIRRYRNWCIARRALLKMPQKIQEAAANGFIKQGDLYVIASVALEHRMNVFNRIMEKKELKGAERNSRFVSTRPTRDAIKKRFNKLVNAGLGGFIGRLLLWSSGTEIADKIIDEEIQNIVDKYKNSGIIEGEKLVGAG